jgi:hypothetical protein
MDLRVDSEGRFTGVSCIQVMRMGLHATAIVRSQARLLARDMI